MKNLVRKNNIVISFAVATILFTGCSVKPEFISKTEIKKDAISSMDKLNEVSIPVTKPISLDEAINRAIKHNLSKKVEVLNSVLANKKIDIVAFEALPSLTAQAGYNGRDEYAASASTTFTDGKPAPLDPNPSYSVSQDKQNTNAGIGFSWNILDFGVSYVRANQQADRYLIAKEKERKAINNISQEVRTAYYKAVSADELLVRIKPIMAEARSAFEDSKKIRDLKIDSPIKSLTYQRELLEVIRSLNTLEENLVKSKTELSRLMGLKPGTQFTLSEKIKTDYKLPELSKTVQELEKVALENRPELQETRYQERISQNEVKVAMLKMLPGINLNAGYNYDGSDYLLNSEWMSYGASISWNLLNVFNGNLNQKLAKTQVELAKAQKLALSMAVITQVHMSVLDYYQAVKQYKVAQEYYEISDEIFKIIESESNLDVNGKLSLIKEKLNYVLSGLRLSSTYANVQNTYGKIVSSTGNLDVFNNEEKSMEKKIEKKIDNQVTKVEIKKEEIKKEKVVTTKNTEVEKVESKPVETPVIIKDKNSYTMMGIAKKDVNIREKGNLDSQIVEVLKEGDTIDIIKKVYSKSGTWYKTPKGFVSEELLRIKLYK